MKKKLIIAGLFNFFVGACALAQCPNGGSPSGPQLVTNGDFTAGDTGFSSSYVDCPGPCNTEGTYTVCTNPTIANSAFQGTDHTTGSGNFLAVNGNTVANTSIWCQSINVTPNTDYVFSAWVCSLVSWNPAQLQFTINTIPIGPILIAPSSTNTWIQFSYAWNSGNNTTANICIVNQNTQPSGNDFGIDDISFMACCVNLPSQVMDTTICAASSLVLNANGGSTYVWNTGDTTSGIFVDPSNDTTYTVSVINGGCSRTDSFNVTVVAPPTLNITAEQNVCSGSETQLSITGANSYVWSTGASGSTVTVIPMNTQTYYVTATNNYCSNTDSVTVTVADGSDGSLYVPNVFTPNADGLNETFKVASVGIETFKCEIFNRWGVMIYAWEDADGGWDGRIASGACPEGVYEYVIHYKTGCGIDLTKTGYVTILR